MEAGTVFGEVLESHGAQVVVTCEDGVYVHEPKPEPRVVWAVMDALNVGKAIGVLDLSGMVVIAEGTLSGCRLLRKVVLATGLEALPEDFFKDCARLEWVNLDECGSMRTIGQRCFENCVSLREIAFPLSLRSILRGAFDGSGIVMVSLGACRALVEFAFFDCAWLEEVRAPTAYEGVASLWRSVRVSKATSRRYPGVTAPLQEMRLTGMNGRYEDREWKWTKAAVYAETAGLCGRSGRPALPI